MQDKPCISAIFFGSAKASLLQKIANFKSFYDTFLFPQDAAT